MTCRCSNCIRRIASCNAAYSKFTSRFHTATYITGIVRFTSSSVGNIHGSIIYYFNIKLCSSLHLTDKAACSIIITIIAINRNNPRVYSQKTIIMLSMSCENRLICSCGSLELKTVRSCSVSIAHNLCRIIISK